MGTKGNNSFIVVSVFWLVVWTVLHITVLAQENPLAPVVDPAVVSVEKIPVVTGAIVVTGKVHVVRDDDSYRVREIEFISDDGRTFKVQLDGNGRQLVKVLKSKIIRIAGVLKEGGKSPILVVQDARIVGSSKKPEVVNVIKPESTNSENAAVEPKPGNDMNVEVKTSTNVMNSIDIRPSINFDGKMDVKVGGETNIVKSVGTNPVSSAVSN